MSLAPARSQRLVRIREQGVRRPAVRREHGPAGRGAHAAAAGGDVAHRVLDPARQQRGAVGAGVGGDDRELVAALACDEVLDANLGGERAADLAQDVVALEVRRGAR